MGLAEFLAFLGERLPELRLRTGEHLVLTGLSTGMAVLAGLPLGICAARVRSLRGPVTALAGILQTIPSLAMLVILLALFRRIGAVPAVTALTLYALLPIVRNTLAGLEGVPPAALEAARGLGMTGRQRLLLVELPLAMPVIVAGIRTAAVVGVGIATLSAFIGAGGLGQFINRGLALADNELILLGALPAALLALLVDGALAACRRGLDRRLARRAPWRRRAALLAPLGLVLLGIMAFCTPGGGGGGEGGRIRIGTKNFTEQLILGELMAQLVEGRTELAVDRRFNLGGTMICHGALVNGEIQLYPEYTGTALTAILEEGTRPGEAGILARLAPRYRERFDLEWLSPFGFDNTYTLTMREDRAASLGLQTISGLVPLAPDLRAGFTAEFSERPDGYPGLRKTYGLRFGEVLDLDPALMYRAIAKGEVDVICAFATDGRIAAYDLQTLADDRGFFPPYRAAPVARVDALDRHPELRRVLGLLAGRLDEGTMRRLNRQVDEEGRRPAAVAREFLAGAGLLR